jgi:hypothetical protein
MEDLNMVTKYGMPLNWYQRKAPKGSYGFSISPDTRKENKPVIEERRKPKNV